MQRKYERWPLLQNHNENNGWTKVTNKQGKNIQRCENIISNKGNLSYAEILKKVKTDNDLKDLRTQKRDVMSELKRSRVGKTDGFRTQVKNSLGEHAALSSQKHEIYGQCKDLEEVIPKEGISTALKEQFWLQ